MLTEAEAHDGGMVVCDSCCADARALKACPSLLLRSLDPAATHAGRQPQSSFWDEPPCAVARSRGAGPGTAPPGVPGAHPEVIIGDGGSGVPQARIPEPDGEHVISRYTLRELLDKLGELIDEYRGQPNGGRD